MSFSYAKIVVKGNVGKVESQYTNNGKLFCKFSVAVNSKRKDEDVTTWYNGVVWERQAELFAKMVEKGTLLEVGGSFEIEQWTSESGKSGSSNNIKQVYWFDVAGKGKKKEEESDNPYDAQQGEGE